MAFLAHRRKAFAGGGGGYDTDAADYFTRAEALGGSFDIDATYTESVVKTAISDFVAGCKTDSVWSDLVEVYLMSGVDFSGITAKLKYDSNAVLINSGFVSGDYTAAGSGGGLTGDNSSSFDTDFSDSVLDPDDRSQGLYRSLTDTSNNYEFGAYGGTECGLRRLWMYAPDQMTVGTDAAFFISTKRAVNDVEAYKNGSSIATDTSSAASTSNGNWYLFKRGVSAGNTASRVNLFFLGNGLSGTQASNLSTRVETLMDALGCGVVA